MQLKKRMITSPRLLLFSKFFSIKETGCKEKIKLTLEIFFDNPLSKCLISYYFILWVSSIHLLFLAIYQNWKGSRTSFWCTFSAYFFHKNISYLILYQLPCSNIRPFLRKISNNMCFKLFNQLMTSKTLRFIIDHHLEQWLARNKRGGGKCKNKKHFS